jgi:hypothetical protein
MFSTGFLGGVVDMAMEDVGDTVRNSYRVGEEGC